MKHKDCKHQNRICRYIEGVNDFNPNEPQLCDYCKQDELGEFVVIPNEQVVKNRSKAYDYIF